MSDWFTFWGGKESSDTQDLDTTLATTREIRSANKKLMVAESVLDAAEGITGLLNIGLYKKERDNEIKAIENKLLAGQEQIFKELSYNTDQALVYAARGNVSIASPVMMERMKKGAEEAGRDFAMLQANADIAKINADIKYSAKRRATFDKALKGVMGGLLTYGALSGGGTGGSLSETVYGTK